MYSLLSSTALVFFHKFIEGFFGEMQVCMRLKICNSVLSYHKFINRHFFKKLTGSVLSKRGEFNSMHDIEKKCLEQDLTAIDDSVMQRKIKREICA